MTGSDLHLCGTRPSDHPQAGSEGRVRDSKNPSGPLPRIGWSEMIDVVKVGWYDHWQSEGSSMEMETA